MNLLVEGRLFLRVLPLEKVGRPGKRREREPNGGVFARRPSGPKHEIFAHRAHVANGHKRCDQRDGCTYRGDYAETPVPLRQTARIQVVLSHGADAAPPHLAADKFACTNESAPRMPVLRMEPGVRCACEIVGSAFNVLCETNIGHCSFDSPYEQRPTSQQGLVRYLYGVVRRLGIISRAAREKPRFDEPPQ